MYAEQGEGSNGWQGTGEARSNGWPLGLQQPLQIVRRGFGEAPSFFMSTPSVTSESSSDLDTESTGSFFPEKSTTLGSLIGIQSSSRSDQSQALVLAHGMTESERRKSISTGTSSSLARSRTSWCPMLGCRGGSNREALGMSPSLAHLLEEERKATGSQRQGSNNNVEEGAHTENDGGAIATPALLVHQNTLFDEEGILPPQPSGAPLKLILQHTSPSSSYLSADWNVFNSRDPHQNRGGGGAGGGGGPKFSTFWPNFCGTGLAT